MTLFVIPLITDKIQRTDYYFNGGDMPNENYIPFLETEYRNYLTKLNINPNDRTLDEDLWLFINFGTR